MEVNKITTTKVNQKYIHTPAQKLISKNIQQENNDKLMRGLIIWQTEII